MKKRLAKKVWNKTLLQLTGNGSMALTNKDFGKNEWDCITIPNFKTTAQLKHYAFGFWKHQMLAIDEKMWRYAK